MKFCAKVVVFRGIAYEEPGQKLFGASVGGGEPTNSR